MRVTSVYPKSRGPRRSRERLIAALRWPFLLAAYLCPILNIATGGRAWSVIVLWSLWIVWSSAVAPALVEYNLISQLIKLISNACVLLILIGALLSPGWAPEVVPIVCFSGLIVTGALFFTDLERQRQNLLPLLLLAAVSVPCSVAGLIIWHGEGAWSMAIMGALALAVIIACAAVLGPDFRRELKKRFHTK